jgi:hypothetical protein
VTDNPVTAPRYRDPEAHLMAKPKPFFPDGYYQGLFTQQHHDALANIINDYKQATGEFQSVRGLEDTLSLYFSKDNTEFDLTAWRKGLSRTDH